MKSIQVQKLTPLIGAELGGVDLARPLSNGQFDEIHRALAENLVIFFRDQHMSRSSTWVSAAGSVSCTFIRLRRMHRGIRS